MGWRLCRFTHEGLARRREAPKLVHARAANVRGGRLTTLECQALETTHGGTAGGRCFFDDGFFGWCVFCFSIIIGWVSRKWARDIFYQKSEVLLTAFFFSNVCFRVAIWWGMWDSDLEKKEGSAFEDLSLKIGDRNWRAKVVYFNRSSGVSGPDVTPKIIHGAKHVLKFNR